MANNRQHAVVIGGGIVGNLTAYLLASQGLQVTVIEADSLGSHASGFAFGELGDLEGAGIPDPLLILACGATRDIKVCRLSCMPPPV